MTRKRFEVRAKQAGRIEAVRHRFMTRSTRAVVLSALCILGPQQLQAEGAPGHPSTAKSTLAAPAAASARAQERCPEVAVDVEGASSDQRRLACSAARRALGRLGQCDIVLQRPLRIQMLDEVRHPRHGGLIFGFFDTAREVVLVAKDDRIPDLVRDTPYGVLQPLEFYKSVIVHEVVHGVMHQNLRRRPTSNASYEYPAYAIQLESLPSDERQKLLRATSSEIGGQRVHIQRYYLILRSILFRHASLSTFHGRTEQLRSSDCAFGRRGPVHTSGTTVVVRKGARAEEIAVARVGPPGDGVSPSSPQGLSALEHTDGTDGCSQRALKSNGLVHRSLTRKPAALGRWAVGGYDHRRRDL